MSSTGEARESTAAWTTYRGEKMVSYTETIYHSSLGAKGCLIAYNSMAYGVSGYWMLWRDFAVHRCYGGTI